MLGTCLDLDYDWFMPSRVFLALGLTALLLAVLFLLLHIYVHQLSRKISLVAVLVACCVAGESQDQSCRRAGGLLRHR